MLRFGVLLSVGLEGWSIVEGWGWGIVEAWASRFKVQHSRFIFGRPTVPAVPKDTTVCGYESEDFCV